MRRTMSFLMLLSFILTMASVVDAATLTWVVPTYTNGEPLPPYIASELTYWPRWGHSPDGPWFDAPYTDQLTATLPDPEEPGETHWYTVCAEWDGVFYPYAKPRSKTMRAKDNK